MPEVGIAHYLVVLSSSLAVCDDVTLGAQLGNDLLYGAFGDAYLLRNVTHSGVRLSGKDHQYVPVVGQECPALMNHRSSVREPGCGGDAPSHRWDRKSGSLSASWKVRQSIPNFDEIDCVRHMVRYLTMGLGVLVLTLTLTIPSATGRDSSVTSVKTRNNSPEAVYSRSAITSTNAHRVKRKRLRLSTQTCLERKALSHAKKMAKQRRMFHQDLGKVLRECGLSMVAENVAYGYPTGTSVVNDGWMKSPGHRANILQPKYRLVGVAARKAGSTWYVAQVFGRS